MVEVRSGSEKCPKLFKPRSIGKLTAPNSVKYTACSVSTFSNRDGSRAKREYGRMENALTRGLSFSCDVLHDSWRRRSSTQHLQRNP